MNPAGHSENTLYYGDNLPILREPAPKTRSSPSRSSKPSLHG
jgi:hypothetical protein